ncbi:MAG: DUF4145 domain-containing protein [Pseudanabaena sp. CAN_BIN31]|nr:DUF4145 domain-containing protein [Pseudanabaena sp. CAN_BIN31]
MDSANFKFLQPHDIQLVCLGSLAERYFQDDPSTCLIKLRQFAELLAQWTAVNMGLTVLADDSQVDLLRRLKLERSLSSQVLDVFHQIRLTGNKANHQYTGDLTIAVNDDRLPVPLFAESFQLKSRQLSSWLEE